MWKRIRAYLKRHRRPLTFARDNLPAMAIAPLVAAALIGAGTSGAGMGLGFLDKKKKRKADKKARKRAEEKERREKRRLAMEQLLANYQSSRHANLSAQNVVNMLGRMNK